MQQLSAYPSGTHKVEHRPLAGSLLSFEPRQPCAGAFGTVYQARMDGAGEVAVKVVQVGVHTKHQLAAFVNEVSVLHDTRHPHIVLMLGAYLGQQHVYMVRELLHSDLYCALGCEKQRAALRWGARCECWAGCAWHGSMR